MKKSELHQIVGVLITKGHKDLAKEITSSVKKYDPTRTVKRWQKRAKNIQKFLNNMAPKYIKLWNDGKEKEAEEIANKIEIYLYGKEDNL